MWKLSGKISYDKIVEYMDMEDYENLDDEQISKDINKIIEESRVNARAAALVEITEGMDDEERISVLREAKKQRLNTKEVYEKYNEIR